MLLTWKTFRENVSQMNPQRNHLNSLLFKYDEKHVYIPVRD